MFVLLTSKSFGQDNLKKGDVLFDQNKFEEAIPFYQLEADDKKSKYIQPALLKLGKCYDILGKFLEAERVYIKLIKMDEKNPDYVKNLALSLKASAKYEDAARKFKIYTKLRPEDPMGKVYLQSCYLAQLWLDENIQTVVRNLDSLNSKSPDFAPTIANERLYFSSSKEGSTPLAVGASASDELKLDFYSIDLTKGFTTENKPVPFKEMNTPMHEGPASFSADGNELYFTRPVTGVKKKRATVILNPLQIFVTKKDGTGRWSTPQSAISMNSHEYSCGHPSISPSGKKLFFMSDKPGGLGGTDIYVCERKQDGSWDEPKNLGEVINTFGYELFPYCRNDSTLYFSSNTHPGLGKLDIFEAKLVDGKWTEVTNLKPPINSVGDDFGIVFDGSYQRGFFSSDRFNGHGKDDIYSFVQSTPLEYVVNGNKIYFVDQEAYDDSRYKLTDAETKEEIQMKEANGMNYFELPENKEVVLTVRKEGFAYNKINFKLWKNEPKKRTEIEVKASNKDILLRGDFNEKPLDKYHLDEFQAIGVLDEEDKAVAGTEDGEFLANKKKLYKIISQARNKKPSVQLPVVGLVKTNSGKLLEKTKIYIVKNGVNLGLDSTKQDGTFNFTIWSGNKYTFSAIKRGYFKKDIRVNAVNLDSGTVTLEFVLDSIELNKNIRLDNIYYDYNSAELRKTSLIELDKLAQFIKANPTLVIEISSHTDSRGNDDYNMELSQARAETVVKFLMSYGILKSRLVAKGYGESVPILSGAVSEEDHQQNRRTEFKILKK